MLDLRQEPEKPLQTTLTNFLKDRRLLLVLDNCEHVVAACARLAETLLRACPKLRILASSREPLGIAGETAWPLPPLSLPDHWREITAGQDFGAAEAQRIRTGLVPQAADHPALRAIIAAALDAARREGRTPSVSTPPPRSRSANPDRYGVRPTPALRSR